MGWAAVLINARRGNVKAIKKLITLAEKADSNERSARLFKDIATVHNEMCVKYLYEYLKTDYRETRVRLSTPGILFAGRAAYSLSLMLEGFPECKKEHFYNIEEIQPYIQWMKVQTVFRFKEY